MAATVAGPAHFHVLEDEQSPDGVDLRLCIVSEWSGEPRDVAVDEHDDIRWMKSRGWTAMALAHPSVRDALMALL